MTIEDKVLEAFAAAAALKKYYTHNSRKIPASISLSFNVCVHTHISGYLCVGD